MEDLSKSLPDLKDKIRVTIIQSQDHILNTYDQSISKMAEEK